MPVLPLPEVPRVRDEARGGAGGAPARRARHGGRASQQLRAGTGN